MPDPTPVPSPDPTLRRAVGLVTLVVLGLFGAVFGTMVGLSPAQVDAVEAGIVDGACPPVEPCECPAPAVPE